MSSIEQCRVFFLLSALSTYELSSLCVSEVALGYLLDAEKSSLGDQIKFHQREMLQYVILSSNGFASERCNGAF